MNADGERRDAAPPGGLGSPERRQQPASRGPERRDLLADRYELLELIGRGGSASVWHAYDKRLAREVALKIFHVASQDREALGRALREAKAASHIVSDHVVRIRDVAWGGAKGAYIDMELCADFVDGELVVGRSMAQTRPRDLREVVRWVVEAARGVQTAHELRVFHRDLKPDNILIRPSSRVALVTDFGLARQPLWREEDDDTPLPGRDLGATWQDVQNYVGTPAYMAPEQADGLFRHLARLPRDPLAQVDPRDEDRLARIDVYGLGAILYEGLTGQPPYQPRIATSDRNQEALDVLSQVRAGPPPALRGLSTLHRRLGSARTTRRFRVPQRLDRIVRKAMSRNPLERYPTCAAMERDLASFLEHQPTSFERHRYHAHAALWSWRNWRPLLASSIAVATFLTLFSVWPEDGSATASASSRPVVVSSAPATEPSLAPSIPASAQPVPAAQAPAAQAPERNPERNADKLPRHKAPVRAAQRAAHKHRERTRPRSEALATAAVRARNDGDRTAVAATATPPGTAVLSSTKAVEAASEAPSGPDPSAARANIATLLEGARREATPLVQVLAADGAVAKYCLLSASGKRASSCVSPAAFFPEERQKLERLHRQSARSFIWHLDAQRRVIRKCEKSRPYDNSITRTTCDPVAG
jgi:serine/threonine protein kinase